MGPLARALEARGIIPMIVWTGQHEVLQPAEYGLDRFPSQALGCSGRSNPHRHVRAVSAALLRRLHQPPALIAVQGDTSSALGAALAACTAGVALAHVEAGLRTHDPLQPWPEEEYRTAIDARADLLFAPTDNAAANLRAERVAGAIHVTGNTGIDALLAVSRRLRSTVVREDGAPRILVTCHRRESWGDGLQEIASACQVIAAAGRIEIDFILHPNPEVARPLQAALGAAHGVSLLPPCGHAELVLHMQRAALLLSDSGGIQEEAPALGVPLLVLREKTERPEGIATGNARLVGTCATRIVSEVERLLSDPANLARMRVPALPYGDGRAGERIAAIMQEWLSARRGDARSQRHATTRW